KPRLSTVRGPRPNPASRRRGPPAASDSRPAESFFHKQALLLQVDSRRGQSRQTRWCERCPDRATAHPASPKNHVRSAESPETQEKECERRLKDSVPWG